MGTKRSEWTRRKLLRRSGTATVVAVSALAGCLDSETDETNEATDDAEPAESDDSDDDSSATDETADADDGSDVLVDMTGEETIEIELVDGEESDDGAFAFRPDHVQIDAGTTVRWISTHDIFHTITSTDSLEQKSPSGAFRETVSTEGDSYEWNADEPGTQHYYCEPHAGFMDGTLEIV
ncbi:cupredoxin domain-containing protein [Natronorubrum thiooxidans]|uniref:Copper binding protein, plastocyanin/azurin family n=1 Tax=Natronorubrum thiooxidans TaxID=308853 RepID=A0A1N7GLP5_9EURY|nr:plastocyanin/azurin family copper-binding protein [Natronorubrum thiooxidans]SIS13459.1 Copper binding protein, plastocyanin/azurin family [Natronorubrum thiooxidans]